MTPWRSAWTGCPTWSTTPPCRLARQARRTRHHHRPPPLPAPRPRRYGQQQHTHAARCTTPLSSPQTGRTKPCTAASRLAWARTAWTGRGSPGPTALTARWPPSVASPQVPTCSRASLWGGSRSAASSAPPRRSPRSRCRSTRSRCRPSAATSSRGWTPSATTTASRASATSAPRSPSAASSAPWEAPARCRRCRLRAPSTPSRRRSSRSLRCATTLASSTTSSLAWPTSPRAA